MTMDYATARRYQHVYEGKQGANFMNSRPAFAICGYEARGKGEPAVGRCPDCTAIMDARRTVTWTGNSDIKDF